MKLPSLARITRSRSSVTAFGGYDHTPACAEGEWYEEENLSARCSPALAPRLPRTLLKTLKKPHGLYAKNGLIWVDGTQLYYNGAFAGTVADNDKVFCGIGAKVLIWPDKVYLDTTDRTLYPLGAKWASTGNVGIAPAREDGAECEIKTTGAAEPETPENGDYWLDTGGTADTLRVYSAASGEWSAVSTTYLKISAAGIGKGFARYDTVSISGFAADTVGEDAARMLNADLIVWSCGDDFLVVTGLAGKAAVQSHDAGEITVERRIPDLDFLVESDNRIWGCSGAEHTVYACKQGDPTNWFSYMGTAADSYAATVGSDGDFTGAAVCLGYVLFFKENLVHKVYGTKPANYQITTVACRGVRSGAAKSLVTAGETLYYLSGDGVMQYDGSLPSCISTKFGPERYTAGAAGAAHGEVRFSLCTADGEWQLYCYDTAHGTWHREKAGEITAFAGGENLYALNAFGELWAFGCAGDPYTEAAGREAQVAWYGETGEIGLYAADHRFVSRIELRMDAAAGTALKVEVLYDDTARWETLKEVHTPSRKTLLLPIIPRRHTAMRLRISGRGEFALYSMTKLLEQGSEL